MGDNYYGQSRAEMLRFIPVSARCVLDVGCGEGEFGSLIKSRRPGTEVWGVEPVSEASSKAAEKLDRVVTGLFPAAAGEFGSKKFDCIVFNDVIEHTPEPEQVLAAARGMLEPEGVVVASIPNILHFHTIMPILRSEDWRYMDSGVMDRTHLRFFTRRSIERLFREANYQIEAIEGVNAAGGASYRLANLLTLGRLRDWKYVQFAVRARPSS